MLENGLKNARWIAANTVRIRGVFNAILRFMHLKDVNQSFSLIDPKQLNSDDEHFYETNLMTYVFFFFLVASRQHKLHRETKRLF